MWAVVTAAQLCTFTTAVTIVQQLYEKPRCSVCHLFFETLAGSENSSKNVLTRSVCQCLWLNISTLASFKTPEFSQPARRVPEHLQSLPGPCKLGPASTLRCLHVCWVFCQNVPLTWVIVLPPTGVGPATLGDPPPPNWNPLPSDTSLLHSLFDFPP